MQGFGNFWTMFIVASLAVSAMSITLTRSNVSRIFRERFIEGRSTLLNKLMSCPYCAAHWLAAPIACLIFTDMVFLMVFAIVALSSVFTGIILTLFLRSEEEIQRLLSALNAAESIIHHGSFGEHNDR